MKLRLIPFLIIAGLLPAAVPAAARKSELEQAASVTAVLEAWQKTNTQPTQRVLHIIAWTPQDREFPAQHVERLTDILKHIQAFYAREMERNGFGAKTFSLALDPQGQVIVHQVRGVHPETHYGKKSGNEIREECRPVLSAAGVDLEQETVALFCNLAHWDEQRLTFEHNSPYYASGDWQRGIAWQLDSPELSLDNLVRMAPMMHDGQYGRISLGRHNSIFIGGMAHEFGHAFGLPHCWPRPDETVMGQPIMGSGNRRYGEELRHEGPGSFLNFAHALQLASQPLFCGRQATDSGKDRVEIGPVDITADTRGITVQAAIHCVPPAYGVIVYFDTEGNDDYNATCTAALPDRSGRFKVRSTALMAGKAGQIRIVPLLVNGSIARRTDAAATRFAYRVTAAGVPDISAVRTRLALAKVLDAVQRRDQQRALREAAAISSPRLVEIANNLVANDPPTLTPAQESNRSRSENLTHYRADVAKVGWLKPAFNQVPGPEALLECAGVVYPTGIYAHAPAQHEYSLGDRWTSLAGRVGLAAGHEGSVQFVISGDGRELWRSDVIRGQQTQEFRVDLAGVDRLKLETLPTEDGSSNDWGLWLAPQLLHQHGK